MPEIVIDYAPRGLQLALHKAMDTHRWVVAVCHRRFGKTVMAVNHLQRAALMCPKERPRFHYIAPTYRMGKQAAWDYFKHYSSVIPGVEKNEAELRINYPTGAQIQILGADNPDSMRGIYSDGAVFDEYGLQPPNVFTEVMRPAFSDRQGWALFIGTPNGRNQFQQVALDAQRNVTGDWFFASYKASETGYVPALELQNARVMMTADEYAQEYECSFEAAVKGAIYSGELQAARDAHRLTVVPVDPILPVDTDWDLGVGDATAIWFSQSLRSGEIRLIDYYESSGEGLPHYAKVLKDKGYVYGQHWAPHDIQVKEFASGRSRLEAARSLGIDFQVAPNIPIEDGIHAVRMLFPKCWFDSKRCEKGLEALQHYRRDYNTRLNEFKAVPVHDWACFTPDTEVLTRYGTCQIIDLPENGEVLTPCGWKRYQGPKLTRRSAQLVEVTFESGYSVRCTPDHLFLTADGWISASDLVTGLEIQSCSTASLSISTVASGDSGRMSDTSLVGAGSFIAPYGLLPSEPYQTTATYTTAMVVPAITAWTTWNAWPWTTTVSADMRQRISTGSVPMLGLKLPNGIALTPADSGIDAKRSGHNRGRNGVVRTVRAFIVGIFSRWWFGRLGDSRNTVQKRARPLHIAHVKRLSETSDVWCIHVPYVECFTLANGAVVHNSHGSDAIRYLAVRHETPHAEKPVDMSMPTVHWSVGV